MGTECASAQQWMDLDMRDFRRLCEADGSTGPVVLNDPSRWRSRVLMAAAATHAHARSHRVLFLAPTAEHVLEAAERGRAVSATLQALERARKSPGPVREVVYACALAFLDASEEQLARSFDVVCMQSRNFLPHLGGRAPLVLVQEFPPHEQVPLSVAWPRPEKIAVENDADAPWTSSGALEGQPVPRIVFSRCTRANLISLALFERLQQCAPPPRSSEIQLQEARAGAEVCYFALAAPWAAGRGGETASASASASADTWRHVGTALLNVTFEAGMNDFGPQRFHVCEGLSEDCVVLGAPFLRHDPRSLQCAFSAQDAMLAVRRDSGHLWFVQLQK